MALIFIFHNEKLLLLIFLIQNLIDIAALTSFGEQHRTFQKIRNNLLIFWCGGSVYLWATTEHTISKLLLFLYRFRYQLLCDLWTTLEKNCLWLDCFRWFFYWMKRAQYIGLHQWSLHVKLYSRVNKNLIPLINSKWPYFFTSNHL